MALRKDYGDVTADTLEEQQLEEHKEAVKGAEVLVRGWRGQVESEDPGRGSDSPTQ
jgi:hypothetical protein